MAERRWMLPGTGSLRGRLLWRLGGLLLVLLLIGSAATYWRARHAADIAYDRTLLASARDIADGLYASDGTLRANVPYVALDSFEYDSAGRIFYQVIDPHFAHLDHMGAKILCIEKYRPHVPYPQAVMGIRFNAYMIGTQFHPEADAIGMSMYLQTEEKKKIVIEDHGENKWRSMIEQLNDPDKIMWTYAHILPNFLNEAVKQLARQLVAV